MEEYLERYPPPSRPKDDVAEEVDSTVNGRGTSSPAGLPVDVTVDLHGLTVDEGQRVLDQFVKQAVRGKMKKVLIIHGMGDRFGTTSPMKRMVRDYLEKNPTIGAMGVPEARDGGRGATWAIIRQRSR